MLPALMAIFDAPPRPDRDKPAATGFEPVLMQALAAAPRAVGDCRPEFSSREKSVAPPLDNARGKQEEIAAIESAPAETEAPPEPAAEADVREPKPEPQTGDQHPANEPQRAATPQDETDRAEPPHIAVDEPALTIAFAPADVPDSAPVPTQGDLAVAEPDAEAIPDEPDAESPESEPSVEAPADVPAAETPAPSEIEASKTPAPKAEVSQPQAAIAVVSDVQAARPDRRREEAVKPAARAEAPTLSRDVISTTAAKAAAKPARAAVAESLAPRVVEQVQRALKTLTLRKGAGDIEARIALSPPSLGALRLTVRLQDGELTGSVVTDNAAARHLLQTHLPELREALANQGVTLGQFNISQDAQNARDHVRTPYRGQPSRNTESTETAATPQVASVVAGRVVGYM